MRVYGVERRVRRAAGQIVLCDRYLWDTLADFEVSFPGSDVASWPLWKLLLAVTPAPDGAFLLDLDVRGYSRRCRRSSPVAQPPELARLAMSMTKR